ncbi:L-threonine 3-O-phosphate decarboxylase [Acidisarcina polymorpha]|uniref:Aminotransferase n=1 Tax=Acidisarcina polymorpha TaxID=2211140 RepID=A0A2Z5G5L9_9BACT|nr:aminotransferase class I/II-fold pyridoxal phosphate-dependent enzyme [Acidisarcina polymorpha]AXC14398.1 L-threonine 3-O-phosphate decarboxylase [Acidisarcina polymorpha]
MIADLPIHGGQLRRIAALFNIPESDLIDFSANINPDGPPSTVLASLQASLEDSSTLNAYPDLEETELKDSIAEYAGVSFSNVAVANGFVPLLDAGLRALKIKRCLLPVPGFVEYRRTLERARIEVIPYILTEVSNFNYSIEALLAGGHDAILLANPQNPSGILTNREFLVHLVQKAAVENITVLLDEAFIDYTPSASVVADVDRFSNLIVFRSVTKFHGVPGLRVAYAAANEAIVRKINDGLPPWPITTLAARAVAAALADQPFAESARAKNEERRVYLHAGLERLCLHPYPSSANFLLFRLPDRIPSADFWRRMIVEHHFVLRDCSNYEALSPGHFRVAVGAQEQSDRLLNAISQLLKSNF